ncbi:MAG: arabinose-5-phosphate isomerase [Desulfobacca sp. 4484_104]|nr:MAG: arabinose-5-phosphate isomerase [Desulfobacca sp. 4484_104]RLA90345.1 MAG: KpsF/GutQ family sugar-phosphate isomerase [Deltaproteobacteria bacterium]
MVPAEQQKIKGLLQLAQEVLTIEAEGICGLIHKLDGNFVQAVEIILGSKGRLIVTGIGKSGIVARKLVATFNSTGTPALFLHPVEAMHGDLGMVAAPDVMLALSNSGETKELTILLPSIERLAVPLIALTGQPQSTLARHSRVTIDVGVPREACPLGLAPTASTTAALAMGDALAVALLTCRGFKPSDFRRFHPGGSLGARLSLAIAEVMLTGDRLPLSHPEQSLRQAIVEMDDKRLGTTLVVDNGLALQGIITDGDLRRALKRFDNLLDKPVQEVMTRSPQTIGPEALASQALELMEHQAITVLPVVDQELKVLGIIHLHDLLGRGEFKFNT